MPFLTWQGISISIVSDEGRLLVAVSAITGVHCPYTFSLLFFFHAPQLTGDVIVGIGGGAVPAAHLFERVVYRGDGSLRSGVADIPDSITEMVLLPVLRLIRFIGIPDVVVEFLLGDFAGVENEQRRGTFVFKAREAFLGLCLFVPGGKRPLRIHIEF